MAIKFSRTGNPCFLRNLQNITMTLSMTLISTFFDVAAPQSARVARKFVSCNATLQSNALSELF
jgi:hypothetical protein